MNIIDCSVSFVMTTKGFLYERHHTLSLVQYTGQRSSRFLCGLFPATEILDTSYYSEDTPGVPGRVMTVSFRLRNQIFKAINKGPQFEFTPAVSFAIDCETQDEIDLLWDKLGKGGKRCPVVGLLINTNYLANRTFH